MDLTREMVFQALERELRFAPIRLPLDGAKTLALEQMSAAQTRPQFLFCSSSVEASEREVLQKIASALSLPRIEIIDGELKNDFQPPASGAGFVFGEGFGGLRSTQNFRVIREPRVRDFVANPTEKRRVWERLKSFVSQMNR